MILAVAYILKDIKHYRFYRVGVLETLLIFIILRLVFPLSFLLQSVSMSVHS
jgi:hypothetical protein